MLTDDTMAAMRTRILDLANKTALILDEGDREFILGLQMLVEMEETPDASCVARVEEIYKRAAQNSFL
jgi:hypothetical protein